MNYKWINEIKEITDSFFNNVIKTLHKNNFLTNLFHTIRHSEQSESATHVSMSNNNRRVAFTLAEVLITLGIIGIVAALTIPTLMSNYREKLLVNQLKKLIQH